MFGISLFRRDPFKRMAMYRDRADRAALAFLEGHAVAGTISREIVHHVADIINRDPRQLIRMVPDIRRKRRYEKAMAAIRAAGLLNGHAEIEGPEE